MHSTKGVGYSAASILKLGPLTVRFKRTHHPVPAFAMRITDNSTGKTLVFTADSNYFSGLASFANRADFLITDTNYYAKQSQMTPRWHMTSSECGKLAKESKCPRLLLSHLPQTGDQRQLIDEAQLTAGRGVKINLARQGLEFQI